MQGGGFYYVESAIAGFTAYFHEDELISTETYVPEFKPGDKVIVIPLTDEEKEDYPVGWVLQMEDYVGETLIIERLSKPRTYFIEGCPYYWHASNLQPASEFIGY